MITMDKNKRKLKILYKCMNTNTTITSAICQHKLKYSSPNRSNKQETRATQKSLPFGKWRFRGKQIRRMGHKQKRIRQKLRKSNRTRQKNKRGDIVGSNWQPWDSRQRGDITNPPASLQGDTHSVTHAHHTHTNRQKEQILTQLVICIPNTCLLT